MLRSFVILLFVLGCKSFSSTAPSCNPSTAPSCNPTTAPSCNPTTSPSCNPTTAPSCNPTTAPTTSSYPTARPSTSKPTSIPTSLPSSPPTSEPSIQPTIFYCTVSRAAYEALEDFYISTKGSNVNSCIYNKWFVGGFEYSSPTPSPLPTQPSSEPSPGPSSQPSSQPTLEPSLSTLKTSPPVSSLPSLSPTSISSNDPCMQHWYGITCDRHCNVLGIILPECNLQGKLPNTLGLLNTLKYLDINNNNIGGSIPNSIINMTSLTYLRMSENMITGSLPIGMSELKNISYFYIRNNMINEQLPYWLFGLPKLVALDLSYNKFTGGLNVSSNMQYLKLLNLEGNILTGNLVNLHYLTSLNTLFLGQNCFDDAESDHDVDHLCNLYELQTLVIDGLSNNCEKRKFIILRGSVPSCIFTTLTNITQLSIAGNYFGGTLPHLNSSSSLVNMSIADNKIEGTLPSSFQKHSFMNLDISFNRIQGHLIEGFKVDTSLNTIMNFNRLSGPVPTSFITTNSQLNILEGNLFGCNSFDKNRVLLKSDKHHKHFQCGTTIANTDLYIWMSFVLILIITIGSLYFLQAPSMYRMISFLLKYKWIDHWRNILIAVKKELMGWWNISSYYLLIPQSKWDICVNVDSTLFQTRFTLDLLERISSIAIVLSALNVFIYLPCYIILKKVASDNKYVLCSDQYFYSSTAAYFRGTAPVIVTFIFQVISSICCSLVFVALIPVPKESVALESTVSVTPSYMSIKKKRRFTVSRTTRLSFIQVINAAVALAWNCGYVRIYYFATSIRYQTIEVLQHLLAVVTLFNIFKLAPKFTSLQKHKRKSSKHKHLIFMSLMYLLVAPTLSVLLFSPWCLYYHLFPNIVSSTFYQTEYIYSNGQLEEVTVELSVQPSQAPWYYSFQCSSSVVVSYFPILSTMYLFLAIFDPLLKLTCMFLSNEGITTSIKTDLWSRLLITLTSPIYLYAGNSTIQTLSTSSNPTSPGIELTTFASVIEGRLSGEKKTLFSKKLLNPRVLMTRVCMDIIILLTFGLASPILGVFVTISMVTNAVVLRLAIGRFLTISKAKGDDIFEINSKRIDDLLRDEWRCVEDNWSIIAIVSGLFWYLFVFDYVAEYNVASGVTLGILKALLVPAVLICCKKLFTSMNYGDDDIESNEAESWKVATLVRIKKVVANIHFFIWRRFFRIIALSKVQDTGIGFKTALETISPLAHRTIVQKVYLRSGTITIDQYKASLQAYYAENNPEKVSSLDTIIEAYASFEQALLDQLEEKYQKPVIILKKTNDVRAKIVLDALNEPKISRISDE